ncbi:MAG TPA: hypothetical protein VNU01_09585 [Egibacteraceae bacterium]|nr:hypothetical protein [Egibacteraceae bacterium]
MKTTRGLRALTGVLALALALTACGGGDEEAEPAATDSETEAADAGEEIQVTGVDYAYEGAPSTAEAGTRLTFANGSENEAHEMVLVRIQDGEERPLEELLALPQEESESLVEFQGVAFAFPGEEAMYPEGETVLSEAGRYAIVCFIPVGQDIEQLRAAIAAQGEDAEGPPEMGDGPPHFTQGMAAEITVS